MGRSDRTRTEILRAARAKFAERGFEATTVRMIAEDAGIDPALVIRYFRSKEALFARVIEVDLDLPGTVRRDDPELAHALVRRFLEIWEDEAASRGLAILLRAATTNAVAAEKIRTVFAGQVVPFVEALGPPEGAERRAGLVVSQIFGMALCRYILRLPPLVELSQAEIVAHLAPAIDGHLRRST